MIALITGASRGIGEAIAERLAAVKNAKLFLVYRSRSEEAENVAERCRALGAEVDIHQADVSDGAAAAGAAEACIARFDGIDVLVNNAGVTADGLTLAMADDDWRRVLSTNLDSIFYLSRAVARPMMLQRKGRIINLSSVSARRPNRGQANYAASKGGLEAFTRALAVEMAPKGVTVNAVAPGIIETDMSQRVRDAAAKEIKKSIPMRRFGSPADVAGLVAFLAGPDSAYMTGQVIGVDGGVGL